jgi:hypothetical protein
MWGERCGERTNEMCDLEATQRPTNTAMSHKDQPQGSATRISHKVYPEGLPTRSTHKVYPRVAYRTFKNLQEPHTARRPRGAFHAAAGLVDLRINRDPNMGLRREGVSLRQSHRRQGKNHQVPQVRCLHHDILHLRTSEPPLVVHASRARRDGSTTQLKKAIGPSSSDGPTIAASTNKPSSVPIPRRASKRVAAISLGPELPRSSSTRPAPKPTDRGCRGCPRARAACACTRWGLPCLDRHRSSGALLPHRFTLTGAADHRVVRGRRRSILCGTVPSPAAGRWELPTTLSYRARTFLPMVSQRADALVLLHRSGRRREIRQAP